MSVFKALKGTFQTVQQDIVDGLRALTSLDSSPRHERIKQLRSEGISLDAGADMLYRYQKEWAEIQNYTTDSAGKAEEIDRIINGLLTVCERQWDGLCHLEEEVGTLPSVVVTLNSLTQVIESLQMDFVALEEELDMLENVCEVQAMERDKTHHVVQLVNYCKNKEAEAMAVKAKLWSSLKDKAKEVDMRKSHALQERQVAFQEAFTSDMDFYRTHGHLERLPSGTEFPKVTSLSEITLEENNEALDEFLSSGEENAAGGSFIEDDYTADYNTKNVDEIPDLDITAFEFHDEDEEEAIQVSGAAENVRNTSYTSICGDSIDILNEGDATEVAQNENEPNIDTANKNEPCSDAVIENEMNEPDSSDSISKNNCNNPLAGAGQSKDDTDTLHIPKSDGKIEVQSP